MDYIELLRQEKLIFGGINYKIINGIIDYILTMVLKQDRLWKYDTKHIMEIYRIIIIEPLCLAYLFIYLYSIFITIWVGLFVIGDFAERAILIFGYLRWERNILSNYIKLN